MAILILENPQDSGTYEISNHHHDEPHRHHHQGQQPNENYKSFPRTRKPSRTLIYLRNRATASNLSVVFMAVILVVLASHRLFSLYMTHRRWINAPSTYIHRICPATSYPTLSDTPDLSGKVCITTLTDSKSTSFVQRWFRWRNFDGILEITWQNKQAYANKHGYHFLDASHLIDISRPPAWSKIKAVQYLLHEEECDWVMWMDADTVIMNSQIKVQDFLPHDFNHDLLVTSDNGGGFNSGVFVFRNSEWSKQFLQDWWDMDTFVRPPGFSLSGDNNAMKELLRTIPDFDAHVLAPPRCTFNSFAKFLTLDESLSVMDRLDEQEWYLDERYYHRGDFVAHTPGYDNKAECLRLLLQETR